MQWSYVVRNRRRWSGRDALVREQSERARLLTHTLGMTDADLQHLASARIVQVEIPYEREEVGWGVRVFPWEFVLTAATRPLRRGAPLTVVRQLVRSSAGRVRPREPRLVLYVESAPGTLADEYSFDAERELVRTNLAGLSWEPLLNPTRAMLEAAVKRLKPDIIHLAGFDTHQGLRLIRQGESGNEREPAADDDRTEDGYVLAGESGPPDAVTSEDLAKILCAASPKPLIVSCNIWNSGTRIAPVIVGEGASAAIGFQDSVDDEQVELFFATFYRLWRRTRTVSDAFLGAWEKVRQHPVGLIGSGIMLWSAEDLLPAETRTPARAASARVSRLDAQEQQELDPTRERLSDLVKLDITPHEELNYSLLHNNRPLFSTFKLVKRRPGRMTNVSITADLNAGALSFPYRKLCELSDEPLDLTRDIHASLTADLARSVRESVSTSLFVEVKWHDSVLYRDTHRVRLLPADQWRDNDQDRMWLPCFVLPRDPAVGDLVERAHRYVRVLRDDPATGFDGYQSVDESREDPTEEVDLQVQALWSAIVHEWQLGYINPPPTYSKGLDSQRLRTPSAILKDRCGTCIDLTLLLAACLELVDIYPVIFLLEGHAFPGYWRSDAAHEQFLEVHETKFDLPAEPKGTLAAGTQVERWISGKPAYKEIVRQIDAGNLVPIESVKLTENCGFWAAVEAGKENLRPRSEFHSMIDILSARYDAVTPLPITEAQL